MLNYFEDFDSMQKIETEFGSYPKRVKTKYGNAVINSTGRYQITTSKEGNCGRLLHCLIFEDYFRGLIPEGYEIHHIDGNPLNNDITNLQLMVIGDHRRLHANNRSMEYLLKQSKSHKSPNSTGYFRVYKHKDSQCKQGFLYRYKYSDEGKQKNIDSVNLKRLEEKVKAAGQPWIIIEDMVS